MCLVLVGLAVAGGLALPTTGEQDAEAYSNRAGYSYTQRVCQEWGRQPRHYYVRDEVAGSDWSSSGGWAIIIEGSGRAPSVGEWMQDYDIISTSIRDGNSVQLYAGTSSAWPAFRYTNIWPPDWTSATLPQPKIVVDNSGGPHHGRQGLIQTGGGGTNYSNIAWIDQNRDGRITTADQTAGPSNNQYERLLYRARTIVYGGGSYIRWASMAWCR